MLKHWNSFPGIAVDFLPLDNEDGTCLIKSWQCWQVNWTSHLRFPGQATWRQRHIGDTVCVSPNWTLKIVIRIVRWKCSFWPLTVKAVLVNRFIHELLFCRYRNSDKMNNTLNSFLSYCHNSSLMHGLSMQRIVQSMILVSYRSSDWMTVLHWDNHLQEKNLHQEDPEICRSSKSLTVPLEKWTSYHYSGQKQKHQSSNNNHTGNSDFNLILLLN